MASEDVRSPSTERLHSDDLQKSLEDVQKSRQQMDSLPVLPGESYYMAPYDTPSPLTPLHYITTYPPADLTEISDLDNFPENLISLPEEKSSVDARAGEAAAAEALGNQMYANIAYASANDPSSTKVSTSDGIRRKNARFEIPKERNLQNIDALILAATDENEKKELKQQKRLLRNRQAALDARQRKKTYTEALEQEKRAQEEKMVDLENMCATYEQTLKNLSGVLPTTAPPLNTMKPSLQTSHSGYNISGPLMQEFLEWKRQQELQKQRQQMPMMRDSVPIKQTPLMDLNEIQMYSHNQSDEAAFGSDQNTYLSLSRYVDPVDVSSRTDDPTPYLSNINQGHSIQQQSTDLDTFQNAKLDQVNSNSKEADVKQPELTYFTPRLVRQGGLGIEADLQKHDAAVLWRNASHTQHSSLSAPIQSPSTKEQADMPHADSTYFVEVTARSGVIPPTDSGYDSHKPIHNAHPDHKDQIEVVMEAPGLIKPTYAATNYSDNASLETTKRDTFVEKLAEQLVTDLGITSANASNALKLCDEIVDILAEFALKLGYGTSVNELERAMVFIHKYRKDIGSCFRSIVLCRDHEAGYDNDETRSRSDDMPLSDKMRMYHDSMMAEPAVDLTSDAVDEDHAADLDCAIELDKDPAPPDNIGDFNKYLSYVCKTPHYEWLLTTSRCKITLTSNNEIMSDVRRSILSTLPQAKNVRRLACRDLQAVFSMQWAPQQVLEQRWRSFDQTSSPRYHPHDQIKGKADDSSAISSFTLGDILTITGESSEAQALSCSAYLTQTWPMTGRFILQLLEGLIIYGRKNERSVQRTDGTQITLSQEDEQSLTALVSGTKDAIAEVGEQLAWLGAALRCSPSEEGAVYCTARVSSTKTFGVELNTDDKNLDAVTGLRKARPRLSDQFFKHRLKLPRDARDIFSFNIGFEFEDVPVPTSSSGTCWKQLFQSPVIARGFPVMRRVQPSPGLEMPLNVMAGLLGTTYVHTFGGGVFLKGHSVILYPTQTVEDVVVWHLDFDSRKHYMPYPSNDAVKLVRVNADRLAELRHVVGWCKVAENRTGIVEGSHKTERCNKLSWAKTGCVLEGCALSFGKSIIGGTPFTLLNDHDSLHIIRKSYSTMLNYLSTRFVVFFDVRDRRGWLVNGVNALHHILRTSLEEDKARSIQNQSSLFVLKPNQLVEPEKAGAASAAWQFLDNRDNIFCKISLSNIVDNESDGGGLSPSKEVYETLGQRLEQFHDALEILFNYQIQAEELCGRQNRSRAVYEGWDFIDVTRRRDQRPRMMKLPLEGLACVDLLRSARAITLFGNGFGELILPCSDTCCRGWQTLPKMKYYIASSTADIQKLIEEEGESNTEPGGPPQLSCVGRIMWYSPPASLNNCGCDTGDTSLAKLVQVPWPRKHRSLLKDTGGPGKLEVKGAVVFGYNSLVPWHWPEIGNPRPGPPPAPEAEDSDGDSGLGSSIDSMATDQSTVTTIVPKSMLEYRRGYSLFPPLEQPPKTYGDATVSGGRHNHFGDSFHQTINNYQQQTTDIAVLGGAGSKHQRSHNTMELPSEMTSKKKKLA